MRKLLKRVNFFAGEVESIDLKRKTVAVSHGFDHHHHNLQYDHLVLGLGSITNFYNLPGLAERALTMKSLGDAIHLRNRLIALLEEADTECCANVRGPLLTLVVAGGGFAGVETIAGINDFMREAMRFYPNLREDMLRVVLVHPGDVILPELGKKLGLYTQKKLAKRGVEIQVNVRVSAVSERVELSTGEMIGTKALIWTAGTSPNPVLDTLPCLKERGRLRVNEMLQVPDWRGVWALGDCALVPNGKTGTYHPTTAQHALREGKVLAKNLIATVRNGTMKPFSFRTIGQLAAIGRRTGVANIFGINFFRISRLVVVENDLLEQATSVRKEASCGVGLDSRSPVHQGLGPVSDFSRADRVSFGTPNSGCAGTPNSGSARPIRSRAGRLKGAS